MRKFKHCTNCAHLQRGAYCIYAAMYWTKYHFFKEYSSILPIIMCHAGMFVRGSHIFRIFQDYVLII